MNKLQKMTTQPSLALSENLGWKEGSIDRRLTHLLEEVPILGPIDRRQLRSNELDAKAL
jgi:hypothetical protein